MRSTRINVIIPALLLAAILPAQQSQTPPPASTGSPSQVPTYQATAEEVVLDVIVRDKKGRPVKDLTAADFRVTDAGVEQKIAGVRIVEGAEAIEKGAKAPLDTMRQIRLVTLAFQALDDSGRRIARKAAIDLVQGDQAQNVFYSVVAIDTQLYALQGFTTDKAALKKAVELATSGKYSMFAAESERIKTQLRETAGRAGADQVQPATTSTNPTEAGAAAGSAAIAKRTAEIMLNMLQFDSSFGREESTRTSIFALLSLVRGQFAMPGRKSILYFSQGMWIPPHLDEPFNNILSTANRGNVSFYSVDCRGVMTWSQNSGATEDMRGAAEATAKDVTATDGAVSKEQIMASDRAETSARGNTQMPLRTLSESTGGFLIGESNDLRPSLKRVNEEVSSYYEISYNPGIATYDGKFRRTKVDVLRKDIVVQARNGYFALPVNVRGPAVLPYEFALLKALDSAAAPTDVDFRAGAMRLKSGKDAAKGLVIVEVPMSGIKFTEDPAAKTFKSRVSLMALIRDEKGEVVSKLTNDLPRSGPLNLVPQAKAGNFIFKEQVQVPPGKYTLDTAVIDHEAGKIGVKKSPFIVEARPSGVAVSDLCLVRNYQANVKDLDPNEPLQFQGGKITPTLSGKVYSVKGAQLSTFFTVYPDPAIKAPPAAQIEFLVDGAPIAQAPLQLPPADAQGRIPYVMSAPAESMPAATYEIHLTVKQGDTSAESRMKVAVEAK